MKALYIMPEEYHGLLRVVIQDLGNAWLDLHDRRDIAAAAAKVQAAHRSVCDALEIKGTLPIKDECGISPDSVKRWIFDETMAASGWRDELGSRLDAGFGETADAWLAQYGERCLRALLVSLERLLAHELLRRNLPIDRSAAN